MDENFEEEEDEEDEVAANGEKNEGIIKNRKVMKKKEIVRGIFCFMVEFITTGICV